MPHLSDTAPLRSVVRTLRPVIVPVLGVQRWQVQDELECGHVVTGRPGLALRRCGRCARRLTDAVAAPFSTNRLPGITPEV